MEILAFIAVGLAAGLLSRLIVTDPRPLGLIRMLILGVLGSVVGGAIGGTFQSGRALVTIGAPGLIGAFVGAFIVIFAVLALGRRQRHA